MPPGVIGDQAVAAAHQRAGALHDVASRCGQPVQQDDGRPLSGQLATKREPATVGQGPIDLEELRFHGALGWQGAQQNTAMSNASVSMVAVVPLNNEVQTETVRPVG